MDDSNNDLNFISIIDYIGEINNGVAIILSMKITDKIYELIYWFDQEDNYIMSIDDNFLSDYNLESIYDYKNYKTLAYYIHKFVLYNKEEIINEFLK